MLPPFSSLSNPMGNTGTIVKQKGRNKVEGRRSICWDSMRGWESCVSNAQLFHVAVVVVYVPAPFVYQDCIVY